MKSSILHIFFVIFRFVKSLLCFIRFLFTVLFWSDLKNHINRRNDCDSLIILANGPSLKNELDSVVLSKGDFSVVNDFFKSPYYRQLKPKYHVLADPLYFMSDEYVKNIIDVVDWNMKLFIPQIIWKKNPIIKNLINKNSKIEVIPFNTIVYEGFENLRFWFYRRGLSMPRPQNVVVASIYTAINMGYKEIKLYGVDHSWIESIKVDSQNRVCQTDTHFYDTGNTPQNIWCKYTGEPYKMHEILTDLSKAFEAYHNLRRYADNENVKIVNYTKNSYIDAFERA